MPEAGTTKHENPPLPPFVKGGMDGFSYESNLPMMVEEGEDRHSGEGTRECAESALAVGGDDGDLGDNVELF